MVFVGKKGNFPGELEVGFKYSFKFEVKDKKGKISNIEGTGIGEQEKNLVEGDYEKAAD